MNGYFANAIRNALVVTSPVLHIRCAEMASRTGRAVRGFLGRNLKRAIMMGVAFSAERRYLESRYLICFVGPAGEEEEER